MTTETETLRREADRLCGEADQLDPDAAWPLYSRAGRIRDAAYLLDEAAGYRRLARRVQDPEERARLRGLARASARHPTVQRHNAEHAPEDR